MLGLPGLSVPNGGQLVSRRFSEDLILRAGEHVERAARFSALDSLFDSARAP
jgi:Asp-tRNA(Asn)/Glu-tRNA(Gln) amidotransferase A subunit family amidase